MWISPLSADPVQQAQDPAEGPPRPAASSRPGEARPWRPPAGDEEIVANLEFLESLEFLEEEAAMVDDYEALDKWEGEQDEQ